MQHIVDIVLLFKFYFIQTLNRWLSEEKMLTKLSIVKEWRNPHNENTMYGENQLKALWDDSTYTLCPLFLDYPLDSCPKNKKLTFAKANELRKVRVAKEVNFLYINIYLYLYMDKYICTYLSSYKTALFFRAAKKGSKRSPDRE